MVKKITIIGVGLIGGSFALALKKAGFAGRIVGAGRRIEPLKLAVEMGVVDEYTLDLSESVKDADLIVLAVPMGAMQTTLRAIKDYLSPTAIITDVGSVKSSFINDARAVFDDLSYFVPGHPIAGREQSGVAASLSDLFYQRRVILTPLAETLESAVSQVTELWKMTGATVELMSAEHHDKALASTSHLPHVLAFSLVNTLAAMPDRDDIFRYAAGGFRDFTRIASSDPVMWRDICLANKNAVLQALQAFQGNLSEVQKMIASADSDALLEAFQSSKQIRDQYCEQTVTEPNDSQFIVSPGGALTGCIRVPGDKSISHRAIMLGALADGITHISGFLEGEDSLNTLRAFQLMGVDIEGPIDGKVTIHGVGIDGLQAPKQSLYLGNSGTCMRLLAGILAAQNFSSELSGDESLSGRPMIRVIKPLAQMGANISSTEAGTPPLKVERSSGLQGIHYDMPMASAQVKSCLLLAGIFAEGQTSISEPGITRDHTERMLRGFGYPVKTAGNTISLSGGGRLTATDVDVPGDISSATFFLVGASIAPDSDLVLEHVGLNPTRSGVINILTLMGANLDVYNQREVGGETVVDIRVRSSQLHGISIPEELVPLAIDEFPAIFIAAACATGETHLTGAEELRVKETDRIDVMAKGLVALGIEATPTPDGISIHGGQIQAGRVDSEGDHRIAMSFAMAGLRSTGNITIANCANVVTSFPGFVELSSRCGLRIQSCS